MPIIVLAGEEDFELSRRMKALKSELVDLNWASFNFAVLTNADLPAIIEQAATLPFGPGNRVVVIDHCDLFTKKRSKSDGQAAVGKLDKEKPDVIDEFDQALSAVASNTYLIFACPYNFDSTLKFSKIVGKYATIERFEKERYWAGSPSAKLMTWCQKEAKLHGVTIDEEATIYLLDSTEANLWQVSSEIKKAATFLLPKTHITYEVVAKLSDHHGTVFALLDHFAAGNRHELLVTIDELLSRQSGIPIMATLQTFMAKWIHLKALVENEESKARKGPGVQRGELSAKTLARKLATQLNARSPYAVEMDIKRIAGFSSKHLVAKRIQLCELECKVKTGQLLDRQALTIFLTT